MYKTLTGCLLAGSLVAVPGCSSGGGGSSSTSDPAAGVYAGAVTDADGNAISGARVAIDGIEANTASNGSGSFYIADSDLSTDSLAATFGPGIAGATSVEVSVLAPGYEPYVDLLSVAPGERVQIDLVENNLEPEVMISQPSGDQTFVVDESCDDHEVTIEGFASLGLPESFLHDLILVIDRSGSTANPAFDVNDDEIVDTVLEAEVAAARCFLQGHDYSVTRVCIMSFSDSATTLVDFTDDLDQLETGLDALLGSGGGTNYDAAFQRCQEAFEDLEADDAAVAVDGEVGDTPLPTPLRSVIFLSDGITTAHGVPRDTTDSNLTQSTDDRHAAIDAAAALGNATGAQLYGYSFIAQNDANRKRTTLSHCVAVCGGGKHQELTDVRELQDAICGVPLVSVLSVTLRNLTTEGDDVIASLEADGSFSESVPVAIAPEDLVGAPDVNGLILNVIQVTVDAFSGDQARSTSTSVVVRLLPLATHQALSHSELFAAQEAELPVSGMGGLSSTTGRAINRNNNLYDLLVGLDAQFEDAVEIFGTETFTANDPVNANTTVTVDVVFKNACYKSDVGYIVFDPDDPPRNNRDALRTIPLAQSLFNTEDIGAGCGGTTIAHGAARYQFTVPTSSQVAFFLIPNRTLAQFQSQPSHWLKPLFTIADLNPGNFDQVLEYRTVDGRTEPGGGLNIDAAGPGVVYAFEDISISRRNSDQDFDDLVLFVSTDTSGALEETVCDDD